jgi:hypothetical protein
VRQTSVHGSLRAACAGLASLLLLAGPATVADPASAVVAPPGVVTRDHETLFGLAGDAVGELVLVTGDRTPDQLSDHLWVTTRSVAGSWGAPFDAALGTGPVDSASLALAADGSGVLAWDTYPGHGATDLWVRTRSAEGSWGPAVRLAHGEQVFGPGQVVAATGGAAAVEYVDRHAHPAVAAYDGARWRATQTPRGGGFDPTIALDPSGTVHAALASAPHGGGGALYLTRLAVGRRSWSRPERVRTPYLSSDPVQLVVDARGREKLLYGYLARRGYPSPGDGDYVGSTAYRLVAQRRPGGPLRPAWQGAGVAAATVTTDGQRTRLTWAAWSGHNGGHPRRTVLETELVGGEPVRLADTGRRGFRFDATGAGDAVVSWVTPRGEATTLSATRVTDTGRGPVTVLDDASGEARGWADLATPARLTSGAANPWVAWVDHVTIDRAVGLVTDGAVEAAPLP